MGLEFPGGSAGEESGIVTAVAQIAALAQELLHAMGGKKKKKKREKQMLIVYG